MELRAYRALRDTGSTWAEIAREAGCDWRTVKKYLSAETGVPPAVSREPSKRLVDAWAPQIDAMLTREPRLRATVIHERLVAEHGFSGSYQRVKLYVREARERIAPRPPDLTRRFEVLPGAQGQVDWGDEGVIETLFGLEHIYSFHMTLSYSRDPFTCFVTSQDLLTFWDCHVRAFAHFGGVPASILYDRTKTVVKNHVGRGDPVPLHGEAVAFAAHYGFSIRLSRSLSPANEGSRGTAGRHRAPGCSAGTDLLPPHRDGRRLPRVAPGPAAEGAPHPRGGDRGQGGGGPGGAPSSAFGPLHGLRAAPPECGQGLPHLLPGHHALEPTEQNMLAFLHTYGRAAPVEATTIFDLSPGAYEALAGRLEAEHRMRRVPAGNGYFLELAAGAVCDMESGTCAM